MVVTRMASRAFACFPRGNGYAIGLDGARCSVISAIIVRHAARRGRFPSGRKMKRESQFRPGNRSVVADAAFLWLAAACLTEGVNLSTVYIFLGTAMSLIDMMNSMQNQRLLDNGEYMVIHVDMMTYSPREAQKYLWSK